LSSIRLLYFTVCIPGCSSIFHVIYNNKYILLSNNLRLLLQRFASRTIGRQSFWDQSLFQTDCSVIEASIVEPLQMAIKVFGFNGAT